MILGINTCLENVELCLIENGRIIYEFSEKTGRNHAEVLGVEMKRALEMHSVKSLSKVVAVKGPGAYTSIRIGVATANALAFGFGCKLSSITLFDMFKIDDESKRVFLSSGKDEVHELLENETHEVLNVEFLNTLKDEFYGALSDEHLLALTDKKLCLDRVKSFGEVILASEQFAKPAAEFVSPYYLKDAKITISTKTL